MCHITISRAVDTIPPDHTNQASRLSNLGVFLADRHAHIGAIADLEEAKQCLRYLHVKDEGDYENVEYCATNSQHNKQEL
jgi:hypothetical protein